MTGALLDAVDLIEHGRSSGYFPSPPEPTTVALLADERTADDTALFLRRESGLPWSATTFVIVRPGPFTVRTFALDALLASTPVFSEVRRGSLLDRTLGRGSFYEPMTGPIAAPTPLGGSAYESMGLLDRVQSRPSVADVATFASIVDHIKDSTGLTVSELASLFGRSRETLHAWKRKGPTREARERAIAISKALATVASEPAHRVRDFLLDNDKAALSALACDDRTGFNDRAKAWLAGPAPTPARAISAEEAFGNSEGDVPEDGPARFREYLAQFGQRRAPAVSYGRDLYRELLDSNEDENE